MQVKSQPTIIIDTTKDWLPQSIQATPVYIGLYIGLPTIYRCIMTSACDAIMNHCVANKILAVRDVHNGCAPDYLHQDSIIEYSQGLYNWAQFFSSNDWITIRKIMCKNLHKSSFFIPRGLGSLVSISYVDYCEFH